MTAASGLHRTPLHTLHRRLGARLVDFAGWEMPVQYPTGILAEHAAVRQGHGLFDLSHMGRVYLRGGDAIRLADYCVTRDLARVASGSAAYALLCADDGGILDDVIVYVLSEDEVLIIVNASNRERDVRWLDQQRAGGKFDASLDDRTFETALIGLQGPGAQTALQSLCDAGLDGMPGYSFVSGSVAGWTALIARTGYTGEDGFELLVQADAAEPVWLALQNPGAGAAGALPCGLGARDTLRTEAGYPLYGHELTEKTDPFEVGLGWVVGSQKSAFVGKDALATIRAEPAKRVLAGLRVGSGGVPRPEGAVLSDGTQIGQLTSGTFSPSLRANIGLALLPVDLAVPGRSVSVSVRGRGVPAQVAALPFVPHRTRPRAGRPGSRPGAHEMRPTL